MTMQYRLFDPWEGERRAPREARFALAEQLVLDLATRSGGEVDGTAVYRAGVELGLSADDLSEAVASLTKKRRIRAEGTRLVIAA
ncbi:MAG: hypothetical protein KY457_07900 [Actinobacteria bacterium]|nr:hypothetical protein [Actinomycetota bacterium]